MASMPGLTPAASIYDHTVTTTTGTDVPLSDYRGKVIYAVNAASK